jgi:hypothetical protein
MSAKYKSASTVIALSAAICLGGIVFASLKTSTTARTVALGQVLVVPTNGYVHRGSLWPRLRENLKTLGNRLESPGKERLTVTGALTRAGDLQPLAVTAILQFPDQLRVTLQLGIQARVLTFDGNAAHAVGEPPDSRELDLIELVVYDMAEHFFAHQEQGMATRFLGDHFRLDDGSQTDYVGPFYDVYEVVERVNTTNPTRRQSKLYFFNSNTLLLDRVTYSRERNGSQVAVEIQISNWQSVQGQQVPARIVRLENQQSVLTLTLNSTSLSPKVDDAIFGE